MRQKIFFPLIIGVLLVAWLLIFSKQQPPNIEKENTAAVSQENISKSNFVSPEVPRAELSVSNKSTVQILSAPTNSVDEKIIELTELGSRNDAKSFQKIIASLSDAEPEIRQTALDATIQFGNRDAIPILKDLVAKTEDPQEKIDLLEAAKFLELPSLTEIRARRQTNSSLKPVRREK